MKPKPSSEETLFHAALLLPAPARMAFLDGACTGDSALRQRLEALLAAHEQTETLMATKVDAHQPSFLPDITEAPDEAVGQTLGRYKLLERVGEGGCGVVYVAEQTEPVRRRVALKVIKLGMDTKQVVARFEAERQALAMMDHPNIAKVLDAGTTELGRPFFVMELVRGIRITDYCDQANLSTKERLDLFIKVCHAIQHAHQKGIIHRDIKPSNILVTLHDGVPVPKVIDFGIAKATEGRLTDNTVYTQLHQFIGTPAYMSPEQAEMSGLDIDTRSDIYSLGVLLYELLAGSTPFDAKELMASGIDAMRKTIREKEPVRPSTRLATMGADQLTTTAKRRSADTSKLLHQLKGDLDWIVMKCLEKDRSRRYDTANGLAADLKRHLGNEPVLARPPSAAYKFQKALRRNKLAYAAGLAVAAALLVGLGVSTWAFFRENAAYKRTMVAEREQSRLRVDAEAAQQTVSQQRDLAREQLYQSLVREARSIRQTRRVGYRREVFEVLKQAKALGTTNVSTSLLRREAAATLGDWVGLDPIDIASPVNVDGGALAPDGTLAALYTSSTRLISLRETATGREVASLEMSGFVWSLAFERKGLAFFVATVDFDPNSGQPPKPLHLEKWAALGNGSWKREWSRSLEDITGLSPTSEGPVAVSFRPADSSITLLDLEREVVIARVQVTGSMFSFARGDISADRRQLAFFSLETQSGFDVKVEIWDIVANRQVAVLQPHLGHGSGLSFSPDGKSLAVTYDNTLIVYNTLNFAPTLNLLGSFDNSSGVVLGGAAALLAVPSLQESAVRLVQSRSGREVAFLNMPGNPSGQCFTRDGSVLLLTHSHGARVIHLRAEREKLRLEGHLGGVPAIEFSPDGKRLASVGKDRTLRLWDLAAPGESRVLANLPAPGQTLAFSPDGAFLFCAYYNIGEFSIWSMETGKEVLQVKENSAHRGTTWSSGISADGKHLAVIGTGLRIWELPKLVASASQPGESILPAVVEANGVAGAVFDAAGEHVAYLDVLSTQPVFSTGVRIRELSAGSLPTLVATNNQMYSVQTLAFLPKSGALAYVTQQREITLLDPHTHSVLRSFPTRAQGDTTRSTVVNLRASPDESRLAMASVSGLGVDLWDPATGRLLYSLPEEPGSIWWLAWSPDSRRLAVSRENGEIAIWNLKEVEAQLSQIGLAP